MKIVNKLKKQIRFFTCLFFFFLFTEQFSHSQTNKQTNAHITH